MLGSRLDLAMVALRPNIAAHACSLVEEMRGAARGSSPMAQRALAQIAGAALGPMLALLHSVGESQPALTVLVLKCAAETVDAHISYLEVRHIPNL